MAYLQPKEKRNTAIADTGLGSLLGSETSRSSHFMGNKFRVGG
jgi:hypothetical protein